jgi:hypothetical protein
MPMPEGSRNAQSACTANSAATPASAARSCPRVREDQHHSATLSSRSMSANGKSAGRFAMADTSAQTSTITNESQTAGTSHGIPVAEIRRAAPGWTTRGFASAG